MDRIELFQILTKSRTELDTLAESLRLTPGIEGVVVGLDLPDYSDSVEAYLDIELSNGCGLTWWLDIEKDGHRWVFAPRISGIDEKGQFLFENMPVRIVSGPTSAAQEFRSVVLAAKNVDYYASNWDRVYKCSMARLTIGRQQQHSIATILDLFDIDWTTKVNRQSPKTHWHKAGVSQNDAIEAKQGHRYAIA